MSYPRDDRPKKWWSPRVKPLRIMGPRADRSLVLTTPRVMSPRVDGPLALTTPTMLSVMVDEL